MNSIVQACIKKGAILPISADFLRMDIAIAEVRVKALERVGSPELERHKRWLEEKKIKFMDIIRNSLKAVGLELTDLVKEELRNE